MTNEIAAQPKIYSLDDLDLVSQSSDAFEFEYVDPTDTATGIFVSVLGGHATEVAKVEAELININRKKKAKAEYMASKGGRNNAPPDVDSFEDDVAFGQRLAAARIVGWHGNISFEFSPSNALKLCQRNPFFAAEVMRESSNTKNFTRN